MTGRRSDASGAPMQGNTAGMGQENGFWGERQLYSEKTGKTYDATVVLEDDGLVRIRVMRLYRVIVGRSSLL